MTPTTTAGLMGLDVPAVAPHLVMAERALPPAAIRDVERTPGLRAPQAIPARPFPMYAPVPFRPTGRVRTRVAVCGVTASVADERLCRMHSVTAADYGWIRSSPFLGLGMEVGYCLTLVCGVAPAEVLRVMEAEPLGVCTGFHGLIKRQSELFAARTWDGSFLAGAFTVPGESGDWTLVLHFDGGVGMRAWFLEILSAGSRAVMHSSNGGKPIHLFDWYEDGEPRTTFERPGARTGSTPDDLLPIMEEVWCDPDGRADLDVFDDKANVFALAERLTGVRVTEELLSESAYLLGHVREDPTRE
ncbi:DUF6461 domain-containing protein [Embleya hyalina]|nr:DUF6461 domain-containing protein [Embleya hyalina]